MRIFVDPTAFVSVSTASEGVLDQMWGPNGWDYEVNIFNHFGENVEDHEVNPFHICFMTCFPTRFQSGSLLHDSKIARMLRSLSTKYDFKIINLISSIIPILFVL